MLRLHVSVVFLTLLATTTVVHAQLNGRLTGSVEDPTGAAVPNAKVGLFMPGGKSPLLSTLTNSDGAFDFNAVRPDSYRLDVEAPGFTKYTIAELKIDPARQTGLPAIKLEVSTSSQSVEVTSGVQVVDTATAEISTTVN